MAAITSVSVSTTTMASQHSTSSSTSSAPSLISLENDRKLAQRLIMDFLIFIVILLPIPICEFGLEPYRRGFFSNDESISYPFHQNTIIPVILGLLAGLMPLLTIILIEILRFYQRGQMDDSIFLFGFKIPTWLFEIVQQFSYFIIGLVLTFDATEVGKYTIGRLRPNFMSICQPKLLDGSTCDDQKNQHRYIENYVCEANGYNSLDVLETRRSFPSGHSSLAFYSMIYIAIYIQYRLKRRNSLKLMKNFLQFLGIMIAWFIALSRVTDNWHHWSDVLIGSLIGIIGAILTARIIAKFHKRNKQQNLLRINHNKHNNNNNNSNRFTQNNNDNVENLKISIPRQDTSATLDEVMISTTPPPYIIETTNNYTNEQYSTKV